MNPHDWVDWSNWGIGTAGLVLTSVTLYLAKGAKDAAQDARAAVYRKNSADDLSRLLGLAESFLRALQSEQDDIARHVAVTFLVMGPDVRSHHRSYLGKEGAKLDVAIDLVRESSRKLQQKMAREYLCDDAMKVVELLSGISGVLKKRIEEVEQ